MPKTATLEDARTEATGIIANADAQLPELEHRRRQLVLNVRLGRASAADLEAVASEITMLQQSRTDATSMLLEIEDREQAGRVTRRVEIIADLDRTLADLTGQRDAALAQIRRAPREASVDVLDEAATLERQTYALAHDLHRLVGGLAYRGRMALPLRGILGEDVARRRPSTGPVTNPGRALLDELAAIDATTGGTSA